MTPAALKAAMSGDMDNFLVAATPGGIEAQEKRGQIEQSFAETLPIEGTEKREPWEALGFVFGKQVDGIFIEAKFPKGWRKQPTDHSMWSNILDDKDRKRGMIFYKAAFYDRSAHVKLEQRYSYHTEPIEGWESETKDGRYVGTVKDAGKPIFTTLPTEPEPPYLNKDGRGHGDRDKWLAWMETKDAKNTEAKAWLESHFPDWKSATAYWD